MKNFARAIKEFVMKNGERSRSRFKPRFPRIKRLMKKRQQQPSPRWFSTADAEGNVHVHPIT